jgi:hypothetical protein
VSERAASKPKALVESQCSLEMFRMRQMQKEKYKENREGFKAWFGEAVSLKTFFR